MSNADVGTGVVVLDRDGVVRLRRGHPWIFDGHLGQVDAADGAVVAMEGPAGVARGAAVYSQGSRLPLRVISLDPAFNSDGPGWWQQRLDAALARRASFLEPGDDACRLVHAEADGLPGLVVDRYGSVAVLQAGCRWADQVAPQVAARLVGTHGLSGVLARHDGAFRKPEGLPEGVTVLAGHVPERVVVSLAGLQREVDPWGGQKTGTYLDQRENQVWAASALPHGRRLDAFCHEGGFALQLARAGGEVLALDGSATALERLASNALRNGLSNVEGRKVNVFDELRALPDGSFDGVVLDPPALAKRKSDVTRATRAYRDLNLRALRLLRPGGRLLTCSCSHHLGKEAFRQVLTQAAASAGRPVLMLDERGAARCHPRLLTFPESDYLKVVLLEVAG